MIRAAAVAGKVPTKVLKVIPSLLQYDCRRYCEYAVPKKSPKTDLCKQLEAMIKMSGPLTISEYMKEALINPVSGYYTQREVFGQKGDFITSPEISQMFGELVGIWCVSEWLANGSPPALNVVELGPGRGSLADDMIRVFSQFEGIRDAVCVSLVEVSPRLRQLQKDKLCGPNAVFDEDEDGCYMSCTSKYGPKVSWYNSLHKVPTGTAFYIAHEFLDALPIHKFQKRDGKWHEVLVDIDPSPEGPHHFRYVLAPQETPASKLLLTDDTGSRDHIEVCPEAGVIVQELAERIARDGGFSLIADYGHLGEKSDTFRGFKNHQLHEPLAEPGLADLTADVDFSYIKTLIQDKVLTYGPVSQKSFLINMGMALRMQVLMRKADSKQRKDIISAVDMLTNPEKMGERFKFMGMLQKKDSSDPGYIPAGFKGLT